MSPENTPCLLLCGGLPGSGKSTLARRLQTEFGFLRISTDAVRKELAGVAPDQPPPADRREEVYSKAFSQRTYAEVLDRVRAGLEAGKRVVMDATFIRLERRSQGLQLARDAGVPALWVIAEVPEAIAEVRLAERTGDESDADLRIYHILKAGWQDDDAETSAVRIQVSNAGTPDQTWAAFLEALESRGWRL